MNLHTCILTGNDCYRAGRTIVPKGVMVHSTGANNPRLSRYVAPDDGMLGQPSSLHWNQSGTGACVHAFIGRLADGSVAVYQTLPWDMRGWHCAGSANDTHISFEICEDGLKDPDYFAAVYREAVELTAHLCKLFDLDPLADGVVLCHSEGYLQGIASNHADVLHWFPRFGRSMDDFRADVAREMEDNVTIYKTLQDVPESYRPTIRRLMEAGALTGHSDPVPGRLEDNVLDIDETYCRIMTTLDRLGVLEVK